MRAYKSKSNQRCVINNKPSLLACTFDIYRNIPDAIVLRKKIFANGEIRGSFVVEKEVGIKANRQVVEAQFGGKKWRNERLRRWLSTKSVALSLR